MPFPRCKEIVFAEVSALERVDNCCWLGGCLGRWLLTILIRSFVGCCWMVVGCWLFWSDLLRYFSPDHWAGDLATPLTPYSAQINKQFLKSGSPEWEGRLLLLQSCGMWSQHHSARWWLWPWWPWWWPRPRYSMLTSTMMTKILMTSTMVDWWCLSERAGCCWCNVAGGDGNIILRGIRHDAWLQAN